MPSSAETRQRIDDEIVEVLRGTVLDLEGLLYGYFPNASEDMLRKAIRRLRRQGRIVSSPGGRRGFYVVAEDVQPMRTVVRIEVDVDTETLSEVNDVALMEFIPLGRIGDMHVNEVRGELVSQPETIWVATMEDVRGYQLMAAGRTEDEARSAMQATWGRVCDYAKATGDPLPDRTWAEAIDFYGMWVLEVPLGSIGIYGDSSAERLRV